MARVFGEPEVKYFKEVLASGKLGWFDGGMVTRFEQAFAAKIGAGFGVARNSCMTALAQAVSISGAGAGTEVLVDPIVHFAGVSALFFNAVPRFVDVNPDTYLMDPASVRKNITKNTKALIVTNLFGLCAELDEIRKICDEHGIFMIEDCAHNMGSMWKGKHAGTYGHVGCFSFQQFKHLCTGDGGMIVTNDADIHYKLYHEWAFGGTVPAYMTLNFRMNEVTAAVGMGQLERVDAYLEEYKANLRIYNEAIRGCKWLRPRRVPKEAVQAGYWWSCRFDGEKHGLSYDRFKQVVTELALPIRCGYTGAAAYTFDFFKVSTAYNQPDCPVRCPYYKSDYRYHEGLCPQAEELIPRLVAGKIIEEPPDEIKRRADLLHKAIRITENG
jgi:dTDP-4-amino-4,6-dideoxygalactose transaminase